METRRELLYSLYIWEWIFDAHYFYFIFWIFQLSFVSIVLAFLYEYIICSDVKKNILYFV